MAISGLIRTYGQSNVILDSLEETISSISPIDTPLVSLLNRKDVINTKHEFLEDALRPMTGQLAADVTGSSGATALTLVSGHGAARFPVATNFPIQIRINEEIMLVTSRVTNVLTVTRDYNSSGTAAHSSGATVEIISDKGLEGADARNAFAQTISRPYNMCEIFDATIQVTGTQDAVAKAGIVDTETEYQGQRRMEELKIQLERAMIMGTRVDGTASTYRAMGGLWYYISTNKTNASSVAVTKGNVEADARACYDAGGNPTILLCNSFQAESITGLYEDRIRTAPEDILGGAQITRIRLPIAGMGELAVLVSRWVPQHEYYILDGSRLGLGRLRAFAISDMGKTGDSTKQQVVGEYTLIIKNEAAHARRYGLSTS